MTKNKAPGWLIERPIAHRGLHDGNHLTYENSLSAFERAMDAGFAIECDLQLSKDSTPLVFHDHDLNRLTGRSGNIRDTMAGDARTMRLGTTADTIACLDQMLAYVAGKVPLVLELKASEAGETSASAAIFAKAVGRGLGEYGGQVALMSFCPVLVEELLHEFPDRPVGLTAEGLKPEDFERHRTVLEKGAAFISYNVHHLPNSFIAQLRAQRALPVLTWTVRDREAVKTTMLYADQMTFEGFIPEIG